MFWPAQLCIQGLKCIQQKFEQQNRHKLCPLHIKHHKTKLRGFGPRAKYTDRATAAYWRSSANFCG
jgi:hypothetical protein